MSVAFDSRKMPCICERQHVEEDLRHELVWQSDDGRAKRLRCARCEKTWQRIDPFAGKAA